MKIDDIFKYDDERIKKALMRIPRDEHLIEVLVRHAKKIERKRNGMLKKCQRKDPSTEVEELDIESSIGREKE